MYVMYHVELYVIYHVRIDATTVVTTDGDVVRKYKGSSLSQLVQA